MPSGSILVVDDEGRQREVYRDILQDEGYDTETAPSGESALKLHGQKRFDLVITDLNLTGMTGVQLLTEIVQADPWVAVILITGYPDEGISARAAAAGLKDVMRKPLLDDNLLKRIRSAIAESQAGAGVPPVR